MKCAVAALAALALALTLTGCEGATAAELAQHRDECNALGGVFHQWQGGFDNGELWRCSFDQRDNDEGGKR